MHVKCTSFAGAIQPDWQKQEEIRIFGKPGRFDMRQSGIKR
jgi:hypothetical protein